jgi:alkylation response protein AidB-like acyl-CoA dehydrogenase
MSPEFGGGGVPNLISGAINEILQAGNPAFTLTLGLAIGSGRLVETFGTDELKEKFVENMYTGVWGGTMGLTEPQAGSDLGLVRTKALKDDDTYKISGSKIFITAGDHDLAENIVHLVLARIEGAPEGTRGISLFAVPKYWVNDDGSLGDHNDVDIIGIEDKMGYHASPTCAIEFGTKGTCRGYLVGKENEGLKQMFQMMNEARMLVGSVSLAIAAQAYDYSLAYAKERVQGAKITNPKGGSVRIIEHEDIRRMLMNMKATTEGIRAMVYKANLMADLEHYGENKEEASDLLAFLVPLCKSYASDRAWELTRDAIQVLGGSGFTKEYPVEQLARESKIQSIWEGTNYIQSMDLVGRKLTMKDGALPKKVMADIIGFVKENMGNEAIKDSVVLLSKGAEKVGQVMQTYGEWFMKGKADNLAFTSTRFLDSMSEVVITKYLLEQAVLAQTKLAEGAEDKEFYETKIKTANYFASNVLPQTFARISAILKGDKSALTLDENLF